MKFRIQNQGFTLLEILVVLVILGLISGLLLQGLGYTFIQRDRILNQLDKVQTSALQEWWFRKSCESITLPQVDDLDAKFDFEGNSSRFESITLFPLDAYMGMSSKVDWWLETNDQTVSLFYQGANSEPWVIGTWVTETAHFSYRDNQNQWHEQWPNKAFPKQLPVGILLTIAKGEYEIIWYCRIAGEKKAPINPVFNQ